ncbi:MAG: response regulator transcription factor [Acidobacteriota bacterium]|nr:response regulator transcription factor [Acidobacteriota bacterium]
MANSKPIHILVVDDHFMVRMGLSASLNVEPDMQVVAEISTGEAAIDAYREHLPKVVIMDERLPGMSGTQTTTAILKEFPDARILMLSTHSSEEEVYQALQAGARGYVLKSAVREELLLAIRDVHAGKRHVDPVVAQSLAERMTHAALTTRELEVLRMVVKGLSNKEIGAQLHVAEATVKQHVSHLFQKLNVNDRTQAATVALQRGIVHLD